MTATEQPGLDPRFSPTYPQRVHIKEKGALHALLKSWDERVSAAGKKLAALPQGPDRKARQKTYLQMLGARDQLAEAVGRMPTEMGGLYDTDKLRLEEAVAALERLFKDW